MLPTPLDRLSMAARTLLSNLNSLTAPSKRKIRLQPPRIVKSLNGKVRFRLSKRTAGHSNKPGKATAAINPINTLMRGLTTSLSQIVRKSSSEDYNTIVKGFLPVNAVLLTPEHPSKPGRFQLYDLDGDSHNELVSSYKLDDEVRTIILKKQNEHWFKAAEISSPGYDDVSYRSTAGMTGDGKKQLLLGMTSKTKAPAIHGYSMEGGSAKKLFTRNYDMLELVEPQSRKNAPSKAQLAIWSRTDTGNYNIEVLQWNGSQLEPLKNTAPYYYNNVIPYYVQKVRQTPHAPAGWYNLADALVKAGLYTDAAVAIEAGMSRSGASAFKESFLELKNKIAGK